MDKIFDEFVKLLMQLVMLSILGGGISWLYAKMQKARELRIGLLRDFASLHGRFLSLRYRFNSFHVELKGPRNPQGHPVPAEEKDAERWRLFEEACGLVGEFYGIKPLLQTQFDGVRDEFELLHNLYQQWRRQIGGNQPILQDKSGESSSQFKQLRATYQTAIQRMREQV